MGLLDQFNDPNNAALMQMGLGLLSASGPSRMPVSLGQAIGGAGQDAMATYQAMQRAAEEKKARELAMQLHQLQLQSSGLDLQEKQRKITDMDSARSVLQGIYGNTGLPGSTVPTSGAVNPQPYSSGFSPAVSNAFGVPQGQPQSSPVAGGVTPKSQIWQQFQKAGDALAAKGLIDQAQQYYDKAEKFRPKLKNEEVRMLGGSPVVVRNYEDGSTEVSPFNPVDKTEYQDVGGSFLGKSGITGAMIPNVSLNKTMTPGDVASNKLGWANYGNSAARLAFDKAQADRPVFNADAGGFVSRPNAQNPQGGMIPLQGFSKPLTEAQANANIFATRANEANKILTELEGKYSRVGVAAKQGAEGIWGVGGALSIVPNVLNSAETQQAEQAQRDFVNAILRKESGAAISEQEFNNARKQYFPQPGDSAAVVEQKRKNRILETQGLKTAVGSGGDKFDLYRGGGAMSFKAVPGQSSMSAGGWSAKKVD